MLPARFPVAVVIERVTLDSRWGGEQWRVAAVERDDSPRQTAVRLVHEEKRTCWRFTGLWMELHVSESEGYHLNVTAPEPKVFVMWRMAEAATDENERPGAFPVLVTVSYNEAARLLDGGEQVDATPLSADMLAWMQPFVDDNYRPEPKRKLRRNELYERDGTGETASGKRDR
ncbi:MAG: DUF3305 domain-containing protein [Pseudomonadota bacterium]|nr:DUF3305 domain-containing protein [Pseudomonadota bacterium]